MQLWFLTVEDGDSVKPNGIKLTMFNNFRKNSDYKYKHLPTRSRRWFWPVSPAFLLNLMPLGFILPPVSRVQTSISVKQTDFEELHWLKVKEKLIFKDLCKVL